MSYQRKLMGHTPSKPARGRRRQRRTFSLAPEVLAYIEQVQRKQPASSLSAAVEVIVREQQEAENQARLEQATAAYFEKLGPEAAAEERALEIGLWQTASGLDPDAQP